MMDSFQLLGLASICWHPWQTPPVGFVWAFSFKNRQDVNFQMVDDPRGTVWNSHKLCIDMWFAKIRMKMRRILNYYTSPGYAFLMSDAVRSAEDRQTASMYGEEQTKTAHLIILSWFLEAVSEGRRLAFSLCIALCGGSLHNWDSLNPQHKDGNCLTNVSWRSNLKQIGQGMMA